MPIGEQMALSGTSFNFPSAITTKAFCQRPGKLAQAMTAA